MNVPKVFESEYRFCCVLWEKEPITRSELAKVCLDTFGWKATTTYTVIKRLCERGVLKNENSIITSNYSKEEIQHNKGIEFLDKTFNGSLPQFIAALVHKQDLSRKDIAEIRKMIDNYEGEK